MRSNTKQALLVTLVGVTLFVALLRLSDVLAFAAQLVDLVLPILAGGILALFLSVPMAGLEKRLGRLFAKASSALYSTIYTYTRRHPQRILRGRDSESDSRTLPRGKNIRGGQTIRSQSPS